MTRLLFGIDRDGKLVIVGDRIMWRKIVTSIVIVVLYLVIVLLSTGCQVDVNGGMSSKLFRKGENNGEVWKSRSAGPSYSGGHNGALWTWGNVNVQE